MRVLLDENVPRKLKYRFNAAHDVSTVPDQGWSGLENGALLRKASSEFDVLVTLDQGIESQQNLGALGLTVIAVRSVNSTYAALAPLVPSIEEAMMRANPGDVIHLPR